MNSGDDDGHEFFLWQFDSDDVQKAPALQQIPLPPVNTAPQQPLPRLPPYANVNLNPAPHTNLTRAHYQAAALGQQQVIQQTLQQGDPAGVRYVPAQLLPMTHPDGTCSTENCCCRNAS